MRARRTYWHGPCQSRKKRLIHLRRSVTDKFETSYIHDRIEGPEPPRYNEIVSCLYVGGCYFDLHACRTRFAQGLLQSCPNIFSSLAVPVSLALTLQMNCSYTDTRSVP